MLKSSQGGGSLYRSSPYVKMKEVFHVSNKVMEPSKLTGIPLYEEPPAVYLHLIFAINWLHRDELRSTSEPESLFDRVALSSTICAKLSSSYFQVMLGLILH